MKQKSLKERLTQYMMKRHSEWVPSGEIQRVVSQYTSYTPQNTGRRLRELENEGILEVRYIKGAAEYRIKPKVNWREAQKAGEEMWNSIKS